MILKTSYKMKPPVSATLRRGHLLARGLVGCWLMSEGGGNRVYDLSGNQNTGNFAGDTKWAPGKYGSCLSFDGDTDYVSIADSSSLDVKLITMSVWFKTTQSTATYSRYLLEKVNSYSLYRGQAAANNNIAVMVRIAASSKVYSYNLPYAINDDKWHHLVGTYAGDALRLYLDGNYLGVGTAISGDIDNTANAVTISKNSSTTAFGGEIDHVMIFNRALTAAEVQLLYQDAFCMFQRRLQPLTAAAETIVQPSTLGLAGSLQAPTVIGDVTVTPSALGLAGSLQVPTVDVTVTPSALGLAGSLQVPTVIGDLTVTPSALGLASSLPVPTVVRDVTVTPSALGLAGSLQVPTVVGDVTVTPSVLELAATLLTATVVWPQVARRSHVGFQPIEGANRLRGLRRNALY